MQWVRHPLVHFLLGGVAIFGVYEWSASGARVPEAGGVEPVRIGSGEVAWLQESWVRVWQRPAMRDEMIAMVTSHLKEELLAREARAMGLDRDDTLVRRRLAQMHVIASMQPTHATSDMPWAEDRVGPQRIVGAYAWRQLRGPATEVGQAPVAPTPTQEA